MTQKDVAEALHWSPTKLMRIELGKVGVSYTDLLALLGHYGVTDQNRVKELTALVTVSRDESSISSRYREAISPEFAEFLDHEEDASIIRQFEPNVIPGPLQTRDYALVALTNLPVHALSTEVRDQRVEARLERKDLLTREDAPEAFFLIDESALLRGAGLQDGQPDLMIDQLNHLKDLGRYPNVRIQFLPFSLGIYRGLRSPLVILEFDDEYDDGLIYIESPSEELIIREDVEYIVESINLFQDLERCATPPEALDSSVDRILKVIKDRPSFLL